MKLSSVFLQHTESSLRCSHLDIQTQTRGDLFINSSLPLSVVLTPMCPFVLIFSLAEQRISGRKAFVLRAKDFPAGQKGLCAFSPKHLCPSECCIYSQQRGPRTLDSLQSPRRFTHTSRRVVAHVKIRAAAQSDVTGVRAAVTRCGSDTRGNVKRQRD